MQVTQYRSLHVLIKNLCCTSTYTAYPRKQAMMNHQDNTNSDVDKIFTYSAGHWKYYGLSIFCNQGHLKVWTDFAKS